MEATIAAPPKQQLPFWRKLWFSHPFRFEANLSPEDYAAAIYKYDRRSLTFWNADGIYVELGVNSTNAIPFTITMFRSPRHNYYIHSRTKGEISVDSLSGRTIVTGRVSFYWHLGVVFSSAA